MHKNLQTHQKYDKFVNLNFLYVKTKNNTIKKIGIFSASQTTLPDSSFIPSIINNIKYNPKSICGNSIF